MGFSCVAGGVVAFALSYAPDQAETSFSSPSFDYATPVSRPNLTGVTRIDLHPHVSSEYATSVIHDDRRDVMLVEQQYNAVGAVHFNMGRCTGTYVTVDGFSDVQDRPLVLTAGHCVDDANRFGAFEVQYIDKDGYPAIASSPIAEIHLMHKNRESVIEDMAILALLNPLPAEVRPARLVLDSSIPVDAQINAAGFSADRAGLTEHEGCNIQERYDFESGENMLLSDCDISSGDSGSPVIEMSNEDQLTVSGVTLAVMKNKLTLHQLTTVEHIVSAPFIEVESTVCGNVDASILNVRRGPSVTHDAHAQFNRGAMVHVAAQMNDWSYVQDKNDEHGWVASRYINRTPCL